MRPWLKDILEIIASLIFMAAILLAGWLVIIAPRLDARMLITNIDLARILESAAKEWGMTSRGNVEIRFDPAGAGCPAWVPEGAARTEITANTLTFTPEFGDPVVSMGSNYIIHINPDCRWNDAWLRNVVTHEYGHTLGLLHSGNRKSLMYWVVYSDASQRITLEDRLAAQLQLEAEP